MILTATSYFFVYKSVVEWTINKPVINEKKIPSNVSGNFIGPSLLASGSLGNARILIVLVSKIWAQKANPSAFSYTANIILPKKHQMSVLNCFKSSMLPKPMQFNLKNFNMQKSLKF